MRITHHHDEAYVGALAVLLAVQAALSGQGFQLSDLTPRLPDSRVRDQVLNLTNEPNSSIQMMARRYGASGFVAESVPLALFAASQGQVSGFEEVLAQVITAGGDTDKIASIAGQVMGAGLGYGGLPKGLLAQLPSLPELAVFSTFAEWVQTRPGT